MILERDEKLGIETYELQVTEKSIVVKASTEIGVRVCEEIKIKVSVLRRKVISYLVVCPKRH